jgi:hypothetical protein
MTEDKKRKAIPWSATLPKEIQERLQELVGTTPSARVCPINDDWKLPELCKRSDL